MAGTNGEAAAERDAAVAFLRRFAQRTAAVVHELPHGAGLFNPAIAHAWDFNVVWLDRIPLSLDAAALEAEVERLHAQAGVWHRKIVVADPTPPPALAAGLAARGYAHGRHVLMVQHRPPDRPPRHEVWELAARDAARFTERQLRRAEGLSAPAVAHLVEAKRVVARAGARFFGIRRRRAVVSACDLYLGDGIGQIESVVTDPGYRNRGFARAVVLEAAAQARRAGATLVFLQAEEDDWPKALYAKLGFDPVGTISLFTRTPPRAVLRAGATSLAQPDRA